MQQRASIPSISNGQRGSFENVSFDFTNLCIHSKQCLNITFFLYPFLKSSDSSISTSKNAAKKPKILQVNNSKSDSTRNLKNDESDFQSSEDSSQENVASTQKIYKTSNNNKRQVSDEFSIPPFIRKTIKNPPFASQVHQDLSLQKDGIISETKKEKNVRRHSMKTNVTMNEKSKAYPPYMLRQLILKIFVSLEMEPSIEKRIELTNNFSKQISSVENTEQMDEYSLYEVEKKGVSRKKFEQK